MRQTPSPSSCASVTGFPAVNAEARPAGCRDSVLLTLLAATPGVDSGSLDILTNWWQSEKQPQESLAAFLTRGQFFDAGAVKNLELMQKGYVRFQDGSHLFTPSGLTLLQQRLVAPAPTLPGRTSRILVTPVEGTAATAPVPAADRVEPPVLQVGSVLGKCLLTELLGQGGGGMVFRALHQGLNIPVAVKVLQRDSVGRAHSVYERLKLEARLLAQLNHPGIVRVLDFECDPALPYLVLEYVEGLSLAELIYQSGSLRVHRAVRIVTQVAGSLAAADKLGIVHRDVKPANILIAKDGSAKLADLGLAVVVEGGLSARSLGVDWAPGEVAGTLAYMSPEQFSAALPDHRSDIYSLGATFYHAVTGQAPIGGSTPMEVMLNHAQQAPTPPHLLVPEVERAVSEVILRMMAKTPNERYPSYEALLTALWQLPGTGSAAASSVSSSVAATENQSRTRSSIWKNLLATITGSGIADWKERGNASS